MTNKEFYNRFKTDEDCRSYFRSVRESRGVVCPECGCTEHYWDSCHGRWVCKDCGHTTSLTSGTVMQSSKLPLLAWFTAIHMLTTYRNAVSASAIYRELGLKRYQPVYEMVQKLRSAMGVRDSRYLLEGRVEVDEAFFTTDTGRGSGGPGKRGVGSLRKTRVEVMAESLPDKSPSPRKGGRGTVVVHSRMRVIGSLSTDEVEAAVREAVAPTATVVADAAPSHRRLGELFAGADVRPTPPDEAPLRLPWVHMLISNVKTRILGIYHGVKGKYLQLYLNEFNYTLSRRSFGAKLFDRLVICAAETRPTFEHQLYGTKPYKKKLSTLCG